MQTVEEKKKLQSPRDAYSEEEVRVLHTRIDFLGETKFYIILGIVQALKCMCASRDTKRADDVSRKDAVVIGGIESHDPERPLTQCKRRNKIKNCIKKCNSQMRIFVHVIYANVLPLLNSI